jgi:hypothetical protein
MIHQNKPNSLETQQGHLSRLRQHLRSTNIFSALKVEDPDCEEIDDLDLFDADGGSRPLVSKFIDLSDIKPDDVKTFALYSDATGRFPYESFKGNNYI